ncbi:MAG: SRPBCC family protein [bacterium]
MLKTIKQKIILGTSPHEVYEILMDSKKHTQITGAKAKINREVGGKFTAYDGYCEGTNLKLIPDKKIVQEWRANDWPSGHYSLVTYNLAKNKNGTELSFTQRGVPSEQYKEIKDGWREFYWDRMK